MSPSPVDILHRTGLRWMLLPFVDFAFPPVCIACDARCGDSNRKVCASCLSSISCVGQADQLYWRARARLASGGVVAGLIVPWYFDKDGPLQRLIHLLKYGGMSSIGEELGVRLAETSLCDAMSGAEAIVPVPLHRAKFRERGYNQSAFIARGIASVTGQTILERVLLRTRFTPSQTALGVPQRRVNMPGAFTVPPRRRSDVGGKCILLVDDVITTGATLHACATALQSAGAVRIIACALALAS
jgi:ComF family protein